jgi:hypothetical protein
MIVETTTLGNARHASLGRVGYQPRGSVNPCEDGLRAQRGIIRRGGLTVEVLEEGVDSP